MYRKWLGMVGKWLGYIQPMCSKPGHSWQGPFCSVTCEANPDVALPFGDPALPPSPRRDKTGMNDNSQKRHTDMMDFSKVCRNCDVVGKY